MAKKPIPPELANLNKYAADRQVAARYDITRECVWKWARELPDFPKPIKLTPGCTRWRVSDLEAWEAAQAERSAA